MKKDHKKVFELFIKGQSKAEIARALGLSRQRIYQIISTHGKMRISPSVHDLYYRIKSDEVEELWNNGIGQMPGRKIKPRDKSKIDRAFGKGTYKIFKNGWPDYLLKTERGWVAVEIKHDNDKMRMGQVLIKKFFESIGIPYRILQ